MHHGALPGFYEATRPCGKIVVVDLGFLGDTVHLVPALWEIKNNYPNAELHVLTTPVGAAVLKMVTCVDRAWSFPLGPPSPKWWEHWEILKALRREKFDLAFNFGGADRSVFITRILRPRHAMAYQGARIHFWQPWLISHWIRRIKLPTPISESRREILRLCGLAISPARFSLTPLPEDVAWAAAAIPKGSIHLSLNASFAFKEWPMRNNIEFVNSLLSAGCRRTIFVSAAPNEREQARLAEFRNSISDPRVQFIAEQLSISRLAAMLARCALHVGPDSGMIHLAFAVGTGTASIFRRYHDMADWLPRGANHCYFDAPCDCLHASHCPCQSMNESRCLGSISPSMVAEEILKRLG